MLFSLPALACALQSTHAELPYLQVAAGESSVVVSLEHARAVADLTAERPVVVTAPLAFHAEDRLDRVPLAIEHDVGLYHGVLTLPAGLMLSPIRADADGLTIESPARGLEASITVPCDAIALRSPTIGIGRRVAATSPTTWLRGATALRTSRFHSDPWNARVDGPVTVEVRRPGWVRVAASWDNGVVVRGWIEESATYTPHFHRAEGYGTSGMGQLLCGPADPVALERRRVTPGTLVFTEPDGEPWATWTEPVSVEVYPAVDGWVRVAHAPGLVDPPCSPLEVVWVREERMEPAGG